MGKILAPDGSRNVSVGKVIALLAEEGDDISNLQAPSEPSSSTSQPQASSSAPPPPPTTRPEPSNPTHSASPTHSHKTPSHSRPLFPSVLRLLSENDVANPEEIKGTGVRGMLTKGDVLTYLGKASSPLGSFKAALEAEKKKDERVVAKESGKQPEPVILDGLSVRRVIATNMLEASIKARTMPGEGRIHLRMLLFTNAFRKHRLFPLILTLSLRTTCHPQNLRYLHPYLLNLPRVAPILSKDYFNP